LLGLSSMSAKYFVSSISQNKRAFIIVYSEFLLVELNFIIAVFYVIRYHIVSCKIVEMYVRNLTLATAPSMSEDYFKPHIF